jgi:hypothetical protein
MRQIAGLFCCPTHHLDRLLPGQLLLARTLGIYPEYLLRALPATPPKKSPRAEELHGSYAPPLAGCASPQSLLWVGMARGFIHELKDQYLELPKDHRKVLGHRRATIGFEHVLQRVSQESTLRMYLFFTNAQVLFGRYGKRCGRKEPQKYRRGARKQTERE